MAADCRHRSATPRALHHVQQGTSHHGVPPLALTGERTLPGRPRGELLVPAPPGGVRVDRRAGCAGCGSPTSPAARATAPRSWRGRPPRWWGWTRTRRLTSTPGCATGSETCASSAAWWRSSRGRATRSSFLQTIEHVSEPERLLERFAAAAPLAYITTPNRLTLAPPGAEKSDNPWHLREYTLGRVPRAPGAALLAGRGARRLPRRQAAHPRAGRCGSAGTGSTARFASRSPSTTASSRRSRLRLQGHRRRATSSGALDFLAVCHA